jgi:transposase
LVRNWKSFLLPIRSKSINYSVIAVIGYTQYYAIKVIKGGVKATNYALFLIDLLVVYKYLKGFRPVFLMDNTRILRPKESIKANFDGNIRILYNAPYYPDLNPIENFFSGLKKKIFIIILC